MLTSAGALPSPNKFITKADEDAPSEKLDGEIGAASDRVSDGAPGEEISELNAVKGGKLWLNDGDLLDSDGEDEGADEI